MDVVLNRLFGGFNLNDLEVYGKGTDFEQSVIIDRA